ncbi:MAG: FecR family protein, partial [Candidatus Gracilibacteria bacterium]|nr:FecR family protein [Candidatus Gracilibacteria bacterium]
MKFLKSKFIFIMLFGIFLIFISQVYYISKNFKIDTNSYVSMINGTGFLISGGEKKALLENSKNILNSGDEIYTNNNSVALILWGDKSVTRLAQNSRILIKENFIGEDLSLINIKFDLLKGKTWSTVVSIFSGNSYFKQEINGNVAAVRGTTFEASYDYDYIKVIDHEVKIENKDKKVVNISSGEVFSLNSFSLENIRESLDIAWENLNKNLDKNHFNQIQEELIN